MPESRASSVNEEISRGAVQLIREFSGPGPTKGRIAMLSANHIDPDVALKSFLLQPLPGGEAQAIAGQAAAAS
jgi:hypothetical protein